FALDDDANAEDVHHAAHFRATRREHHFQRERGEVDEFHREQRRLKYRYTDLFSLFQKQAVRLQVSAENQAGDFVGQQLFVALNTLLRRQRFKVVGIRVAERLYALVSKVASETGEHQAGTIDGWLDYDATQATFAGNQLQF